MAIQRLHTNRRMSQIVIHRDTIYLAGQTAENTDTGIEQQTADTLQAIEELPAEAGSDKEHILSVTIYLKEIEPDFACMNAAGDRWLPDGVGPARATVDAGLHESDSLVELSVSGGE